MLATVGALALVVMTPLGGHAQESPSPSAEPQVNLNVGERSLVVAVTQSVDTLNPFRMIRAISFEVARLAYTPLMLFSAKDYSPIPGLAERWEESSDKLTWTYHIRRGATFSDGKPITAKDAAFTYNLMITSADARRGNGGLVLNMASATATDDYTLVIKVKKPSPVMLSLEAPIVPEHIFASQAAKIADYKNDTFPMVGSGPFQVTEFKTDQFLRMKANKSYWGGAPKYDEIVFRYFKNSDAAVLALGKGEVDIVGDMTAAQFNSLTGKSGITQNRAANRRFTSITFNPGAATNTGQTFGDGHPALTDVRVRQAIHQAINKEELVRKALDGYGTVGAGYIPAVFSTLHWVPDPASTVSFDIAKANKILDDAGYKRGPDGLRTMPDGTKPFKFRFLTHSTAASEAVLADHVKGWLKELGIDIEVRNVSSDELTRQLYTAQFDMAISGWGVNPDPDFILGLHICANLPPDTSGDGQDTDTFYCNKDYDAMYTAQQVETDAAKRAAIIKEMQKHLYVNAPIITLYNANALEAYRSDRFTGFVQQPEGSGPILRQQGMWGYLGATPVTSKANEDGDGLRVVLIAGGAVAAVALAAGLVFFMRRRRTADERE
ncbi:MAG TPA: ABC transporter substrate-binding protein [Candidatus Limnocylindrales bacterium]